MAILAESTQQQESVELGEIPGVAGKDAIADTQDHPQCPSACRVAKLCVSVVLIR